MKYKSLKVTMKDYICYHKGQKITSYIDLINEEATKGYSLFQILALPNEEPNTQLTLDIILQQNNTTTNKTYTQGYPF